MRGLQRSQPITALHNCSIQPDEVRSSVDVMLLWFQCCSYFSLWSRKTVGVTNKLLCFSGTKWKKWTTNDVSISLWFSVVSNVRSSWALTSLQCAAIWWETKGRNLVHHTDARSSTGFVLKIKIKIKICANKKKKIILVIFHRQKEKKNMLIKQRCQVIQMEIGLWATFVHLGTPRSTHLWTMSHEGWNGLLVVTPNTKVSPFIKRRLVWRATTREENNISECSSWLKHHLNNK